MKKLILLATALFSINASAQNVEDMKSSALEACNMQASAMPEAQRDSVLKMCKCSVENTDYELMLSAQSDAQAMQEAQTKAMEVAQKCATAG